MERQLHTIGLEEDWHSKNWAQISCIMPYLICHYLGRDKYSSICDNLSKKLSLGQGDPRQAFVPAPLHEDARTLNLMFVSFPGVILVFRKEEGKERSMKRIKKKK